MDFTEQDTLNTYFAEKIAELEKRIAELEAVPLPAVTSPLLEGLPQLADIFNLELTFFDNGKTQGKAQFVLKAEVNLSKKDFKKSKRDASVCAEMWSPSVFEDKLAGRTIADDYRADLKTIAAHTILSDTPTLIGMFGRRGGTDRGFVWHDRQFAILEHDGDYNITRAVIAIGHVNQVIGGFSSVHPVSGKAFNKYAIKSKAIWHPGIEEERAAKAANAAIPFDAEAERRKLDALVVEHDMTPADKMRAAISAERAKH